MRFLGVTKHGVPVFRYKFEDLPVPPTFEAMAAAHLDALRAFQPEGPYLLGGFCNGGLMAYEMARQLQAQGQTVELLALIDPASPGDHRLVRSAIGRFGSLIRASQKKQQALTAGLLQAMIDLNHIQARSYCFGQVKRSPVVDPGVTCLKLKMLKLISSLVLTLAVKPTIFTL